MTPTGCLSPASEDTALCSLQFPKGSLTSADGIGCLCVTDA
jgi:hypothetical protein